METIPINIWDDFHDDGYVPEGEVQESYICVEDDSPEDFKKECLEFLMNHIQTHLPMENVKMWMKYFDSKVEYPNLIGTEYERMMFTRWEIRIESMTHKQLDKLVPELNGAKLKFKGKKIEVYSES